MWTKLIGPSKIILASVGLYAALASSMLAYVYIRQPGHGAISTLGLVLVPMLGSMLVVGVASCVGGYRLATDLTTRTPANVAAVCLGAIVVAAWFVVAMLG